MGTTISLTEKTMGIEAVIFDLTGVIYEFQGLRKCNGLRL